MVVIISEKSPHQESSIKWRRFDLVRWVHVNHQYHYSYNCNTKVSSLTPLPLLPLSPLLPPRKFCHLNHHQQQYTSTTFSNHNHHQYQQSILQTVVKKCQRLHPRVSYVRGQPVTIIRIWAVVSWRSRSITWCMHMCIMRWRSCG